MGNVGMLNLTPASGASTHDPQHTIKVETIETGRISITPCDEAGKGLLQAVLADRRVCDMYFAGVSRHSMQVKMDAWGGQGDVDMFAVRERSSGNVIGCIELIASHLSYFVAPACWGQGYASEMVVSFLARLPALRELDAVYTTVVRENMASRRILEKTGFDFAGIMPGRMAESAHTLLKYVCPVTARLAKVAV